MQQPSIFSRIIAGDIPCHKVYEDEYVLAFLDIHPVQPGHTLVVPKAQKDRLEDLSATQFLRLMQAVRKVMRRVVSVYGEDYRACLKVEGFDVPHAHMHVIPCRNAVDFWAAQHLGTEPDHALLEAEAKKLYFEE